MPCESVVGALGKSAGNFDGIAAYARARRAGAPYTLVRSVQTERRPNEDPRWARSLTRFLTGFQIGAIQGCRSLLGGHEGSSALTLNYAVADDGAAAFGGEDTPCRGSVGTAERERSVGVQGAGESAPYFSPGQRVALMGDGDGDVTGRCGAGGELVRMCNR